ncbi:hypothetical protein ABZ714_09670 [Streptomyces sp. NPDC006798]|uniref:hypothetical protein n=1 Tax=Streptomyces sp. NPDC006798 TaxID=3155462 RepID=UPI0033F27CB3
MPTTELVAGLLATCLAGGLTETGRRAARGVWDRLVSLGSGGRRAATPDEGAEGEDGIAGAPVPGGPGPSAGKYHVVVNSGEGIALGDNISQTNHFRGR